MYEIFEKLCTLKGVTPYRFGKDMNVNSSTLSTWKKKKSLAGPELAEKVCDYFKVSIDFLMGKTKELECPECGQKYNPFDEFDCLLHEQTHDKIIEAQKTYSCLIPYREIANICSKSLLNIQDAKNDRLKSMQEYLKAAFSRYVYENFEHGKHFNYEDFCKTEIVKLIENGKIPTNYIDDVVTIFNIDKDYINQTDLLISRVSNNQQLMRILRYAEKLNPDMLDSIEVQIKALAESNKKG